MEPLGLSRNPFDRIAHFVVGFFAFPLAELFWRNGSVRTRTGAAFFAVMTTVAMAGLWEIVEWFYAAVDGGNAGAAFLGSQGDEWDAQKDILCDTLGALCASVLFLKSSGRIGEIRSHVRVSIMVVGIVFILPLFGGVEGSWSGTLDAMGQKLRLVFHIKENKCTLDSPDQGTFGIVGKIMSAKEMNMELLFKSIGGLYSGKIEEGRLCGTWKQSVASISFNANVTVLRL